MLINYVDDNGNVDNSYHTVWQRELTKMGYPEGDNGYKMRVVSISNGQTPVIDCRKPYIYVDGRASTKILSDILMEFVAPNFFGSWYRSSGLASVPAWFSSRQLNITSTF